ncbi:hypothetical protein D3C71_1848550 [compost metagenome]
MGGVPFARLHPAADLSFRHPSPGLAPDDTWLDEPLCPADDCNRACHGHGYSGRFDHPQHLTGDGERTGARLFLSDNPLPVFCLLLPDRDLRAAPGACG